MLLCVHSAHCNVLVHLRFRKFAVFVVCPSLLGTHLVSCLHVWPFHIFDYCVHRLIVETYVNMQTYTHATCIQTCIHAQLHHVHMHMHKHTTHACLHMHLQLSISSSFVDVSFVDSIQPMVCIPCLHMHLQSLCSTSAGANTQM